MFTLYNARSTARNFFPGRFNVFLRERINVSLFLALALFRCISFKILESIGGVARLKQYVRDNNRNFRAFLIINIGRIVFQPNAIKISGLRRILDLELTNPMHSLQFEFRSALTTHQIYKLGLLAIYRKMQNSGLYRMTKIADRWLSSFKSCSKKNDHLYYFLKWATVYFELSKSSASTRL